MHRALFLYSTSPKASDFDADGQIGFSDFLIFAQHFGLKP